MQDVHNLDRFVKAQSEVYRQACSELRAGRKTGHWMWFIFPQLQGLGLSEMARRYAISSLDEARAYLEHPVLGPRLRECAQLLILIPSEGIREIMGDPDDLKLRSSMTLFAKATSDNDIFLEVLRKYFQGETDPLTEQLLHPS